MLILNLQSVAAQAVKSLPYTRRRAIGTSNLRDLFGRSALAPRQLSTSGFEVLDSGEKVEEENWEWYNSDTYYPVRIGEIFQSRYQVLGKLGYGAHSTAWLGRDLSARQYVTLRVCERDSLSARRELAAYEHLDALTTAHPGALLIRKLLDSFKVASSDADAEHLCLIHEPLGMSVETLRQWMPGQKLSKDVLKPVLKYLFLALDCLHSEAKMVHTDIQATNIHFRIEDESIPRTFEDNEVKYPSPRKLDNNRIIYESRGLLLDKKCGPPVLCDFGEARYSKAYYTDDIQPYVYRAPEVILNIPWSYEADIWNVGVMIWDLFESKHLFSARGPNGDKLSEYHLAEMVAILGPPPLEYLRRIETSWKYFDADDTWKASASIPDISLEASERRLNGDDKVQFLKFVRRMLQWAPEDRSTARQLLEDPWLEI